MKILSFLLVLIKYSLCPLLATLLWLSGWKARTIRINREAFGWGAGQEGPGFLFRWYLSLTRDIGRVLLRFYEFPIRVRPQDNAKLTLLLSSPTLFLTGHFHNWEALAAWMYRSGIPLLGSARALSSPRAQAWVHRLRLRNGVPVISERVLPQALAHLRAGHCFGVLWDQFSPRSLHRSSLFGLPAAMDPLPEVLVRRHRPDVLVGFLLPTGSFRLARIHAAGSPLPDPGKLSRRYHRLLEVVVRAYPTAWYGLCHARFKDVLDYGSRRNVSRETFPFPAVFQPIVSRETQESGKA